jgi:hypothetical protein
MAKEINKAIMIKDSPSDSMVPTDTTVAKK